MGYKYSILMCVYNGSEYIERALKSCQEQTYDNFEVIVTDDGSTDDTVEKIKPFLKDKRFKLIELQKNVGIFHARSESIKGATGDRCLVLDADDALYPFALNQLEAVQGDYDCLLYKLYEEYSNRSIPKYLLGKTYSSLAGYYAHNSKLLNIMPVGRVWKRQILQQADQDLSFVKNRISLGDDTILLLATLRYILSYKMMNDTLYHHYDVPVEQKTYSIDRQDISHLEYLCSIIMTLGQNDLSNNLNKVTRDEYVRCVNVFYALYRRTILNYSYKCKIITRFELVKHRLLNRLQSEGVKQTFMNLFFFIKYWLYKGDK